MHYKKYHNASIKGYAVYKIFYPKESLGYRYKKKLVLLMLIHNCIILLLLKLIPVNETHLQYFPDISRVYKMNLDDCVFYRSPPKHLLLEKLIRQPSICIKLVNLPQWLQHFVTFPYIFGFIVTMLSLTMWEISSDWILCPISGVTSINRTS